MNALIMEISLLEVAVARRGGPRGRHGAVWLSPGHSAGAEVRPGLRGNIFGLDIRQHSLLCKANIVYERRPRQIAGRKEIPRLSEAFAQILQEAREEARVSQQEHARRVNCARSFIFFLETRTHLPRLNASFVLCPALGLSARKLPAANCKKRKKPVGSSRQCHAPGRFPYFIYDKTLLLTFPAGKRGGDMLDKYVKSFGLRGKCYRFRDHHLIKNMKAVHLLSAIAWGGGAFAMQALHILRTSAAGDVPPEMIARCSWFIDTWVVMPGLFGCILTGLFYSIFTSLGFFRFAWIIYKWLISASALCWGLFFWSGAGDSLIAWLGSSVLAEFLRFMRGLILPDSVWASIVQTCIILSMCLISIYRPLSFLPHKRMGDDVGKVPTLSAGAGEGLAPELLCPDGGAARRDG